MSRNATINTTDVYQYLACPQTTRVTLQVLNAGVAIGFGKQNAPGTAAIYDQDETYTPLNAGLERVCDAIRVKSAQLATPAQINITALGEGDG